MFEKAQRKRTGEAAIILEESITKEKKRKETYRKVCLKRRKHFLSKMTKTWGIADKVG